MTAHFLSHFDNGFFQFRPIARFAQHIMSRIVKCNGKGFIAVNQARAHKCLMLPCPGFLMLIIVKRIGWANQQT